MLSTIEVTGTSAKAEVASGDGRQIDRERLARASLTDEGTALGWRSSSLHPAISASSTAADRLNLDAVPGDSEIMRAGHRLRRRRSFLCCKTHAGKSGGMT